MKKKTGDWNTILYPSDEEAKDICRLGQGEKCCRWLVVSCNGWECWNMNYPLNLSLNQRIQRRTMNAKGKECNWDYYNNKAEEIE